MRHKHYDCIVAWADGAEIEMNAYGNWVKVNEPNWSATTEYRIKKEPVIEVKYFYEDFVGDLVRYKEFNPYLEKWHLKITYQDGVAIKAEVAE